MKVFWNLSKIFSDSNKIIVLFLEELSLNWLYCSKGDSTTNSRIWVQLPESTKHIKSVGTCTVDQETAISLAFLTSKPHLKRKHTRIVSLWEESNRGITLLEADLCFHVHTHRDTNIFYKITFKLKNNRIFKAVFLFQK